jgi:hypothetical protein
VSPSAGKKRRVDEIQDLPNLVSSTFNPLEEVDFPRGGSSALTPLEKKEAENEGIRDALFEVPFLGWGGLRVDCRGTCGEEERQGQEGTGRGL